MSAVTTPNPFGQLSARSKRRKRMSRFMEGVGVAASVLAISVLVIVLASVAKHGAPALSWSFLTETPSSNVFDINATQEGGIANSIVGTLIMVAIATGDRRADRHPHGDLHHRVRQALDRGRGAAGAEHAVGDSHDRNRRVHLHG